MAEAAITSDEKCLIYELLGAIDDTDAQIHNGFSVMLAVSNLGVKTQCDAKIAALGDAEIRRIRVILAEYSQCCFDTGSMEGGSAGNLSGQNEDSLRDIQRLRQLMLTYIPVMSYAESLNQRNDTKLAAGPASSSVAFSRG